MIAESWAPTLPDTPVTLHNRLLRALQEDIASGVLEPGTQLPPHRALAQQLGVSVGTVTRAYAEAERLGLLTSTVGRGTFVASSSSATSDDEDALIDLSLNVQSLDAATSRIGEALARLQRRPDLRDVIHYTPHAGIEWHRQAFAGWLESRANFTGVDWRRLAIVTGAQHGMSLVLDEVCRRGDIVLTEAATFSGFLAIAAYRGVRFEGVAMDGEGMIPGALDDAVRQFGSRVVHLQPTLHNPTTRTMSMPRRQAIAEIARRHDLTIIEDDVYSPIASMSLRTPFDVTPMATVAPERTWYVGSVSKALAPGLRVGMVVAPDSREFDLLCVAIRAQYYASSSLASLLVAQWIRDGEAERMLLAAAEESRARQALARRLLGDAIEPPLYDTSLHVWLPMSELESERFANTALRRGVMLTPPSSFLVDGSAVSGVRLCLNAVTRPRLERALKIIRSILADAATPARNSIV
jgi:DNA-binding transcriptional MocR family regulator